MKWMVLGYLLLLSLSGFSQENLTPFDFKEASRKYNQLNRLNGTAPTACETVTSREGEQVMSCQIKDSDYEAPIMKLDFEPGQIPVEIAAQLPSNFQEETKNKKVSCLFRFKLQNDNQQMLGRRAEKQLENNAYGDDFGRTHGLELALSCASEDGISQTFSYSTELYSNPDRKSAYRQDSGNVTMKQQFTSENIFTFLQDNINQGRATYWKRGVGFINLSEKKKWNLLQSTGQQEWFHNVVNSISRGSAYEYQYIDGTKDQWGAFVILAIGLQENRKFGDRCQLSVGADAGFRASTILKSSTLNLNAFAQFSYQVSENKSIYLRAQSELTQRSDSRTIENTVSGGIRTNNGSYVELGVMQQNGNRKDVPDFKNFYTGKNDKQIFLRVGKHF